jgi:hypothetical protein
MCRNYAPQSDVIDPNPPKNASYWKRQAKRLQEELLTANNRIADLEQEFRNKLALEDIMFQASQSVIEDLKADLIKANDRIAMQERTIAGMNDKYSELVDDFNIQKSRINELEEDLGIATSGMNSNWDAYQMETTKTEKLSAENSELKFHLESHGKRINELELEIVKNETAWEDKMSALLETESPTVVFNTRLLPILGGEHWNVGEKSVYFGFFLHGWHARAKDGVIPENIQSESKKLQTDFEAWLAVYKTCLGCRFATGELYGCPIQHHIDQSGWCNQRELITTAVPS